LRRGFNPEPRIVNQNLNATRDNIHHGQCWPIMGTLPTMRLSITLKRPAKQVTI